MWNKSINTKDQHICDKMVIAIPRCLCGATVANCIINACHKSLDGDPNAKITIEKWRKACLLESPYCGTQGEKEESCSIIFDDKIVN